MIRLNTTLFVTLLAFILLVFLGCEVEQTQEGELPDVDVSVEEGQAPAYDVDWANVDVEMTEKTVTVPKVVVVQEEETIQVPRIDVDLPDEEEIERTITVETEVRGEGHELEIQNVYAVNDRLIVVSRLEETGESLV